MQQLQAAQRGDFHVPTETEDNHTANETVNYTFLSIFFCYVFIFVV